MGGVSHAWLVMLSRARTYIYTSCRFMHRGKFVGHNGAVCALEMKGNVMATGSRDRLIKVSIISEEFKPTYAVCFIHFQLYDLEAADSKDFVSQVSMQYLVPVKWMLYMCFQASICTLYPPHYDAVSSLAAHKDLLFSSCGVTIKQWDIKERSLKHVRACMCLYV